MAKNKKPTENKNSDLPRLKPKTKDMLNMLLADPELQQTDAYLATHKTTNRNTARSEASKTIAKPASQIYLKKHVQMARNVMVELAGDNSVKSADRIKASQDILDRNIGKAIQRTESKSENVNLNIEASQELADNFAEFLKQNTKQG